MNCVKDVHKCGDKMVLVKKAGVSTRPTILWNFLNVEHIEPVVDYYKLYCNDLVICLGLNNKFLPLTITVHVILNPVYHGIQSIH